MDFQPNHVFVSPFPMNVSTIPFFAAAIPVSSSHSYACRFTHFQISADAILQFFTKNYGEIEYVGLHTEDTHRVAFVVFREANDARRASVFTSHTIAGCVVDVTLPVAVAHPPNLVNMPDDCVMDILRLLELKDLCNVASVCQRLNGLAKDVFTLKWKELHLTITNVPDLLQCLRTFGPVIHSISLNLSDDLQKSQHNSVLNALVQHCSGTLTCLKMCNFTFETNAAIIEESRRLLVGLKKLHLHKCTISVKWFVQCFELVDLTLRDTHVTYNRAQYQTCPKLKSLKICGSKSWVAYGLHLFLDQNLQLKSLTILPLQTATYRAHSSYGEILYGVPASIKSLTITPAETTRLDHLPALETLRIEGTNLNLYADSVINKLVNANLEYLVINLNYFSIDGYNAEAIGKLKRITTLKLHCSAGCPFSHLLDMVKNLQGLADLVLSSHDNGLSAYNIMVLLEHSPNLKQLALSFADNGIDGAKLQINGQIYRNMLDTVLRRTNGKSLQILIVGPQAQIEQFNISFPMHTALTITCLSIETVGSKLYINSGYYLQQHIKLTGKVFGELRELGLCP